MNPESQLLIIVDPQNDFVTGSLAVPGAEKALSALVRFIASGAGDYPHIIVTLDTHPATHCSFSSNGGSWPDHCIAGSEGSAIWQPLKDALASLGSRYSAVTKGTNQDREEYSIFQNRLSRERIEEIARECGATGADICGLAGDYCVKETYLDALHVFGENNVRILPQFTASLDGGATISELQNTNTLCVR